MSIEISKGEEPYLIVSSDTHAGLQCENYRPYLESSLHDEFDKYVEERHEHRRITEEVNADFLEQWEGENEEGLKGAYDSSVRNGVMDADGISGEIIFADGDAVTGQESPPFGAGLAAGQITDSKLAFGGARAHNRWLEEFCGDDPVRRAGIALVPITHDVDEAVKEIEALAEKSGIYGVMVPTMWHGFPPYGSDHYDKVWAACSETGLVVHTHSGEADFPSYGENVAMYISEVPFWTHRILWQLLFSGKFDRFPGLKYAVVECGSFWIGDILWKADINFGGTNKIKKMGSRMKGLISKLPSEYFGTNVFIGASTMSREEIRRRHVNGIDALMWGTDYPHPEGSWPNTVERLENDFRDVSIEDTRRLLGINAVECYGLDFEGLNDIANRVGPTPKQLNQDSELRTSENALREARWWLDEYGCELQY